jgi:hypothetical protein
MDRRPFVLSLCTEVAPQHRRGEWPSKKFLRTLAARVSARPITPQGWIPTGARRALSPGSVLDAR